ncbi:hypothetical protein SAY87_006273 [Trapa incisa]|uniref:HMA domain-containing protein n=1 Tax=Trapa incisa TaxID=236973 RepID=A0AAN7JYD8_9MYRT|nr:hypothetical protein SAY87_006273 [Trapa incisa]
MHCEGCASKIIKCAKAFEGVEKANVQWEASKLTVEGKVDGVKLRESLQKKTKKKVELVSPQPKKENKKDDDNNTGTAAKGNDTNKEKKAEEKKPKEPAVSTAVMKVGLHCQGCVQKIHKFISKNSGVKSVSIDMQKDLVTVIGTMEAKDLAESLKRRMKREVEIIPQKKGNEKGKNNGEKKEGSEDGGNGQGTEKKGSGSGNGNKNTNAKGSSCGNDNGDGKGNAGKKGDGAKKEESDSEKLGWNLMEHPGIVGYPANTGYGYGYGHGYGCTHCHCLLG